MSAWLLVAIGSALGGVSRYGLGLLIAQRWGQSFPWGTLMVNVLGSFLIGVCGAVLESPHRPNPSVLRDLTMIGFLGGFTTFSAFSLQTLQLLRDGRVAAALINVAASTALCLLAVWLGFTIAARTSA